MQSQSRDEDLVTSQRFEPKLKRTAQLILKCNFFADVIAKWQMRAKLIAASIKIDLCRGTLKTCLSYRVDGKTMTEPSHFSELTNTLTATGSATFIRNHYDGINRGGKRGCTTVNHAYRSESLKFIKDP